MNDSIRVSNLCKNYGTFQLKDVSFTLPQGCIMGLIGENGAGKSTTLKLLLNLIHKDGGEISIFGLDPVKQEQKIKEQIGVVFDENFFHDVLRAKDIPSVMRPVYANWDDRLFDSLCTRFQLPGGKKIKEFSIAANVASLDSTVLLYGESGSGKEVLAHYIHDNSDRKNQPLITVNCAAFPENLIEAELFGYEKGAFTGASREGKTGLVEAADGGTLFLDEINSLPLSVQGKLLRTLEEKSIQRIGSTRIKKVDFRLVAATNRNLSEMVQAKTFREDLYYRIQVIPLTIPPMRNRREDIIPLCLHFLHYFFQKYNIQKSFSDIVLKEVQEYDWPGNVREIRNFVERMVVMTPRAAREINVIPPGMLSSVPKPDSAASCDLPSPHCSRRGPSRDQILRALSECSGHREKAAEYLGISRRTLQYKIKEYHISPRCRYQKGPDG